ncbi:unnamed protein product [Rhizoctonia solani]|uniref:Uncharacterized protein n=1 Tax=Rhizoctonia solani TaxID=456999 RepID=A0A8H3D574_9AGAM|nr:unnamed protein product [Rhizoctonia solani]
MGLLDSVSRLSLSTDDILIASNRTIADVGPFTDAVLGKHQITDIIRDANEGEQTLFTHRSVDVGGVKGPVDPRPVAVGGGVVGMGVREREQDVDVILDAALRLVETYGSMPRAKAHVEDLLDRASEARSRISLLEDELEELKNAEPTSTEPKMPSLKGEERVVVKMEAQLNAARRRRDALREQLAQKQRARTVAQSQHTNTISTPTAAARTRTRPGGGKIPNPFLARLTSALPEKDPDATTNVSIHLGATVGQSFLLDEDPPQWADDSILSRAGGGDMGVDSIWNGRAGEGDTEEEEEEEGTVVLAIPPAVGLSPPSSPVRTGASVLRSSIAPVPAPAPVPVPASVTAAPLPHAVEAPPAKLPPEPKPKPKAESPAEKPKQVQVTPETQANTALIWTTVGKVLVPSSNYGPDTPGPDILETASILQSLSSQSLASSDPQPILTATLLLYLLQNGPSPLPAVRTALGDKEKESESANGLGIKALYACVAKKLLKIDRKGREATVRFE